MPCTTIGSPTSIMNHIDLKDLNRDCLAEYDLALKKISHNPDSVRDRHKAVLALARAGALSHAEAEYRRWGLHLIDMDMDCICLEARLKKDRALESGGTVRRDYARESASIYRRAFQRFGHYYPAINVASMLLLAGAASEDVAFYAEAAAKALDDHPPENPETAYYHKASKAEIALLQRNQASARAHLRAAIRLDPLNYLAHATTLRQFSMILAERGEADDWLDPLRPPKAAHFAGRIFPLERDSEKQVRTLREEISETLQREDIGFLFGALAAGSDVLIAEAIIAEGGELNLVLPTSWEAFKSVSLEPYGVEWMARGEACFAQAASVHITGDDRYWPPRDWETRYPVAEADNVAMGLACKRARDLSSKPVQLLIRENADEPNARTSRDVAEANWMNQNRGAQHIIPLPEKLQGRGKPQSDPGIISERDGNFPCRFLRLTQRTRDKAPSKLPEIRSCIDEVFGKFSADEPKRLETEDGELYFLFGTVDEVAHFASEAARACAAIQDHEAGSVSLFGSTMVIDANAPDILAQITRAGSPVSARLSDTVSFPGAIIITEVLAAQLEFFHPEMFRVEYATRDKETGQRLFTLRQHGH